MKIIRQRRPERFTVLDNQLIENDQLTYRALGVLAYLLSRPDGWRTDHKRLAKPGSREGQKAILTALKELETAGYLVRTKHQDRTTGKWSRDFVVCDVPRDTLASSPSGGKGDSVPSGGKPSFGSPSLGKPPLITKYGEQPRKPSTDPVVHPSNPSTQVSSSGRDHQERIPTSSGRVPSRHTGSTPVDRANSDDEEPISTPTAEAELDLAQMDARKKNATTNGDGHERVWSDLQDRYDTGDADFDDIIHLIGLDLGWQLDAYEERTVLGMLENGAHVKAARNTIARRERQ